MQEISKEEKQILVVIGLLMLVGMVFFGMTHLSGCRKNDSATVFDIPSANAAVVTMSAYICVHVAGAVHRPGVYAVPEGSRTWQAVRAAGGALPCADLDSVNLSKTVADGDKIMVKESTGSGQKRTVRTGAARSRTKKKTGAVSVAEKVNINTATAVELDALPGIGPALAEKIMTYRNAHRFVCGEDLLKVKGVRKSTFDRIRERIEL